MNPVGSSIHQYRRQSLRRLFWGLVVYLLVCMLFAVGFRAYTQALEITALTALVRQQEENLAQAQGRIAELEKSLEAFRIPTNITSRGDAMRLTDDEVKLIARITHAEAEGEPFEGKVMVARVVMNRSEQWGKTVEEVVYAPGQFCGTKRKCFKDGVFEVEDVKAVVKASMIDAPWTHFCNPDTAKDTGFVNSKTWELKIGNHVFGR